LGGFPPANPQYPLGVQVNESTNPGQFIEVSNALRKKWGEKKTALLQFSKGGAGGFDFGSRKLSASLLTTDGRFVLVPPKRFLSQGIHRRPFFQRQQFIIMRLVPWLMRG